MIIFNNKPHNLVRKANERCISVDLWEVYFSPMTPIKIEC